MLAAVVLLAVCRPARRWAWRALRGGVNAGLFLLALAVERHFARATRPQPGAPPLRDPLPPLSPAGHTWRVEVFLAWRGRTARLTAGLITGPWDNATDMEAEAMTRWVAVHGYPTTGTLCARARPVLTQRKAA
jgi:hypothetical protein